MELWWFLEPLMYTAFLILIIGCGIILLINKITGENPSIVSAIIALVALVPTVIFVLLVIIWLFCSIWAPFL